MVQESFNLYGLITYLFVWLCFVVVLVVFVVVGFFIIL